MSYGYVRCILARTGSSSSGNVAIIMSANKSLHLTAAPLCFTVASELGRYAQGR